MQEHGRGLESKARKRPWPRFIVSLVAIMLILVVSCYFYYRVFCLPCAWPSMGHHIIHFSPCHSPASRLSPTPFCCCLPVVPPSLVLEPIVHPPVPYVRVGLNETLHDLTEISLVRMQIGRFDDSIILRTETSWSQDFWGQSWLMTASQWVCTRTKDLRSKNLYSETTYCSTAKN